MVEKWAINWKSVWIFNDLDTKRYGEGKKEARREEKKKTKTDIKIDAVLKQKKEPNIYKKNQHSVEQKKTFKTYNITKALHFLLIKKQKQTT